MRKTRPVKFFLLIALLFVTVLPSQVCASETAAKTSAPPVEIVPTTVFDGKYSYLEKGQGYLSYEGNQKVNIWGESYATIKTDKVGVQLTLQRWTGTAWIDVYYGTSVEESNMSYAYQSLSGITVMSGYYYRTESYHWIKEGSVSETGYRYSDSYLIP